MKDSDLFSACLRYVR